MDLKNFVDVLGPWSRGSEPLYKLLASSLQRAIISGDIAPATRLPAERRLAQLLAISRTTVVAAYDLLRQEEYVERRTGSGTWVRPVSGTRAWQRRDELAGSLARNPFYETLLGRTQVVIDLTKANIGAAKILLPGAFSLPDHEL